jgi:hypothetical protein
MKKIIVIIFIAGAIASCRQNTPEPTAAKHDHDTLEAEEPHLYQPGIGEFMLGIQAHHTKLWFAGKNENWELADFEIEEIREAMEDIQDFNGDQCESQTVPLIFPPLDSLSKAIEEKNLVKFTKNFSILTNSCNTCHRATNHAFNVIRIPESNPFPNQDFSARKK